MFGNVTGYGYVLVTYGCIEDRKNFLSRNGEIIMKFHLMDLPDERKKEIENMRIMNPYTGEIYKSIDFGVSRNVDASFVVFIPKGGDDKKVILIATDSHYIVDVEYEITRLEGKEDAVGNRKMRDYEIVKKDKDVVPSEFAEALCYGLANYRASTVTEENLYVKSNIYFGKKLMVHEFFVMSNGEIFNEEFSRNVPLKRLKEVNDMKFELPEIDSYDHKFLAFSIRDISNENGMYILKKITRKIDFYSEELDYDYYPFVVRNKIYLLKVEDKNCTRELCDYNEINKCMITHRLIRLEKKSSFEEEDILGLVCCFKSYFSVVRRSTPYDEYKFKIYWGNALLVEEF